jgi:hypothetical protein
MRQVTVPSSVPLPFGQCHVCVQQPVIGQAVGPGLALAQQRAQLAGHVAGGVRHLAVVWRALDLILHSLRHHGQVAV